MIEKLAIIMPNWVGDAVMATPSLRALHQRFAGRAEVTWVMQPVIAELLAGSPWCDKQLLFSKRSIGQRFRLAMALRVARPDAIVLFTNSLWTAMAAWIAGVPRRIGYARDGRGWLLTDRVPAMRRGGKFAPVPAIDYYLQLAERLGCDVQDRTMDLSVDTADQKLADQLWNRIGFSNHRPLVVINSSGAWGAAKLWPADHVEQLARRLIENHGWQVLLHCGPSERAAADAVATRIGHARVQSMGRSDALPIGLTKAVLRRASVVVTTDSGPRHIAVALGRPVVSLFGPTDPAWTTTYNVPETELGLKMACRSCWKKACPLGHNGCMRDLGVEMVYGGVLQAMIGGRHRVAA